MTTSNAILFLTIVAIGIIINDAQTTTKKPSPTTSWRRCSCIIGPKVKNATEACKDKKTHDTIRDCILQKLGVYDGKGDTKADIAVAKKIVDEYEASTGQKESLKKSLDTCWAQSANRPEDHRTCVSEILRRRCASAPCPPKEKKEQ